MANIDASERCLTLRNNKVLVSIRYEADQLSNLTIIDYTKDLLIQSSRSGTPMTRWEANRCFRNNVISVFAKGDIRREIMLQETKCPVLKDFWDARYEPQSRLSRIASQDPDLFRILERDETTANGVSTIMCDGHDEILVLDVGYQYLRNVLYVDVVRAIHDFNPCKSVPEDKMRRTWKSIIYNMNYHESEELKAEKLEEMDSQKAKEYWHHFGLKIPVKPGQEQTSRMNGGQTSRINRHPHCQHCGQPVPRMQPLTPPLSPSSPSPSFEETLANVSLARIDTTQDTTPGRPSCPRSDNQPLSPVPPLTQTAQPFSMLTVSLPAQATHPSTTRKRPDQPTPPKPSFSQTAQPISLFTVLLPRQGTRPLSFAPLPSSSRAALPPSIESTHLASYLATGAGFGAGSTTYRLLASAHA